MKAMLRAVAAGGLVFALAACGNATSDNSGIDASSPSGTATTTTATATATTLTPTPAPTATEDSAAGEGLGVGQTLTFDGGTITLDSIRRDTETDPETLANRHEDGSYLVAELTVTADGGGEGSEISVSGWDFSASDLAGNEHEATYTTLDDTFDQTIQAGRKAHGWVEFDIPQGEAFIDWNPFGIHAASWKVNG